MTSYWRQDRTGAGLFLSEPFAHLHVQSIDGLPLGLALTAREASALAKALAECVSELEARLPGRCGCGEPIPADEAQCMLCELSEVAARRGALRVVE